MQASDDKTIWLSMRRRSSPGCRGAWQVGGVSDGASTSLSLLSLLLSPRLGEEFRETGGREAGVAELGQHVAEVGPRVHAQPVATEHEGVDGRSAAAGLIAAEEKPVLPAQRNHSNQPLHLSVVYRHASILEEAAQGDVAVARVGRGLAQRRLRRHVRGPRFQQVEELRVDGGALLQAQRQTRLGGGRPVSVDWRSTT